MTELGFAALFSMVALVLAAFVLMLAAFVVAIAALVALAAFVIAAASLFFTRLHLAAILGTLVDTGLAIVGSAGGVFASAFVMAHMFANLGVGNIAIDDLLSGVVVASSHAESESGSDKSS